MPMHFQLPKTICFLLLAFLLAPAAGYAQKDRIEGFWLNEEKSAKVEIYRAADHKFHGKIVWLKEPMRDGKPKVDARNNNPALRNRPIIGLPILKGLVRKDDDKYDNGEIYDPKNGKTYSCTVTYKSDRELSIRGYIGISLIGRSTVWYRSN